MENQASCRTDYLIENALEAQRLRKDIGANISKRRLELKLCLSSFSRLLDVSIKSLTRIEEGVMFTGVKVIQIQALQLLERLEDKAQGKQRILRVVK